jgi:magnesium transporter
MDFEMVTIREDVSLEVVLRYLRRLKELPGHTDKSVRGRLRRRAQGRAARSSVCWSTTRRNRWRSHGQRSGEFSPDEDAYDAAQAFERYDLISAPVVDKNGKLIGRLTIDEMVDLIREESESEVLNMAGLREEEDIFASVWKSCATVGRGWRST